MIAWAPLEPTKTRRAPRLRGGELREASALPHSGVSPSGRNGLGRRRWSRRSRRCGLRGRRWRSVGRNRRGLRRSVTAPAGARGTIHWRANSRAVATRMTAGPAPAPTGLGCGDRPQQRPHQGDRRDHRQQNSVLHLKLLGSEMPRNGFLLTLWLPALANSAAAPDRSDDSAWDDSPVGRRRLLASLLNCDFRC